MEIGHNHPKRTPFEQDTKPRVQRPQTLLVRVINVDPSKINQDGRNITVLVIHVYIDIQCCEYPALKDSCNTQCSDLKLSMLYFFIVNTVQGLIFFSSDCTQSGPISHQD